jgi:exodeoxyribonuclease III
MKLATWNINSLNVRLAHVLEWLARHQPDVLCLQETKVDDSKFPVDVLQDAGYQSLVSGQKTYSGVAILSRAPAVDAMSGIPGWDDEQKRSLTATINGVRVVCLYVPNGENMESPKYQYKMRWIEAARLWLKEELAQYPKLVVAGDFNIAPEIQDVHDPAVWEMKIHFTAPEREALKTLFALGLQDSFRLFEQPERSYTWWDYRMMSFRRKMGLRIDHILLSPELVPLCTSCTIDIEPRRGERPSDHAPVMAELAVR